MTAVVPTERMYSLSLGSQQGNAHPHWHVAPLPPGVPYDRQQYYALIADNGVLDVDDSSQADLARALLTDRIINDSPASARLAVMQPVRPGEFNYAGLFIFSSLPAPGNLGSE